MNKYLAIGLILIGVVFILTWIIDKALDAYKEQLQKKVDEKAEDWEKRRHELDMFIDWIEKNKVEILARNEPVRDTLRIKRKTSEFTEKYGRAGSIGEDLEQLQNYKMQSETFQKLETAMNRESPLLKLIDENRLQSKKVTISPLCPEGFCYENESEIIVSPKTYDEFKEKFNGYSIKNPAYNQKPRKE